MEYFWCFSIKYSANDRLNATLHCVMKFSEESTLFFNARLTVWWSTDDMAQRCDCSKLLMTLQSWWFNLAPMMQCSVDKVIKCWWQTASFIMSCVVNDVVYRWWHKPTLITEGFRGFVGIFSKKTLSSNFRP